MKIKSNEGAERLAVAIVSRAVYDYQNSLGQIMQYESEIFLDDETEKRLWKAKAMKNDCVRFFHSEYCYGLTGLTGKEILAKIEKLKG